MHDHIDHVLNSMDMFASICENLINYTFNVSNFASLPFPLCVLFTDLLLKMASYEMNGTMKRLTYVTIIFLPLTLLAGYFVSTCVHQHEK